MRTERNIGLDAVRFVAISMIVFFHYICAFPINDTFLTHFKNGSWGCLGTSIFFAVSGMVLRMKYKGDYKISTFYKKRWLSIFPLFYFGSVLLYFVRVAQTRNFLWGGHPWKFVLTLLGVDNYAKFFTPNTYATVGEWFTAVIILLYLLYPLLSKCLDKAPLITFGVVTALYIVNLKYNLVPRLVDDVNPITGLWLFSFGMLLSDGKQIMDKMHPLFLLPLSAVAGVLIFIRLPLNRLFMQNILGIIFIVIFYKAFAYIKLNPLNQGLVFFSKNSYSVYLFHHPILIAFVTYFRGYLNSPIRILLGFMIVYVAIILVSTLLRFVCDKIMQTKLLKNLT